MSISYKTFAAFLASAVLLFSGCSVARPLHRSQANIRASLLKRTPPGTSKRDVEAFIAKEGWHPLGSTEASSGTQSEIEVYFGEYFVCGMRGFGMRGVWGTWRFDSDGRVIDIGVHKENDTL